MDMKRITFDIRSLALAFVLMCHLTGYAQISLTATSATTSGSYTTLKAAFDAINAGTHKGVITIMINASTTETASASLIGSASSSSSSPYYTSVSIYPTTTGLSISGNIAGAPLINLNGADNVTIDGRVNATGSTKSLTISNTSTSNTTSTSTIQFINDSKSNNVRYCTLQGSSADAYSGIIFISQSSSGSGNDNITIDNNDITNAGGNRPVNGLYAEGAFGRVNDNNTISNNNFYDFLNPGVASKGIAISTNNSTFSITGNSFYETTSFNSTAAVTYHVISIDAGGGSGGNGFTVSNNYIGGSATQCGGSAWTKTGNNNLFHALLMLTATGTANNVQGNVVRNISWTNSGSANFLCFSIGNLTSGATAAAVNIGTTSGNTIGATTGTGSIQLTAGASGANFYGISINTSGTVDCQNNGIGAVTTSNASANATNFFGISRQTGTGSATISNNTVGSTSTASSIQTNAASTSNAQTVIGIRNAAGGTVIISGNTIANLVNATSNTNAATLGNIMGINVINGTATISNNTLRDLSIANANTAANENSSIMGIVVWDNTDGNAKTVSGNTIYNLSNTYTSFAGSVTGIHYSGSTTASTVQGNFIHSLSVTGTSSTLASIYGIRIFLGATTYSNNIISLGGNTRTEIYGIFQYGPATYNNNLYYNTVYLSGNLVSGATNKSYALYSTGISNTRDFRNNVLMNARSTANGSNLHYAMYLDASGGTITCNYNNYYVSGTGGKLGYFGADKGVLPIVTGGTGNDANSINHDPVFSATGTTATDYTATAPNLAQDIAAITIDYAGTTRSSPSTMGALANACNVSVNPTNAGSIDASQTGVNPFNPIAFTSTVDASGHTGVLQYKWQASTTGSTTGFSDVEGGLWATYDPAALTQTTWFKRLARVSCQDRWVGAAETNVVEITVNTLYTWNGNSSTAWSTAANWTPASVPVTGATITIPSGLTRYPVLSTSPTVQSLTLSGGTITQGAFNLIVTGNLINNGSINATTGLLSMAGGAARTISGTGTISNLQINSVTGVTITSGAGNLQSVTGTLTPTAGTLTTNANLTLKSSAAGTARVVSHTTAGSVSGTVTVERYINVNSRVKRWRLLGFPYSTPVTLSSIQGIAIDVDPSTPSMMYFNESGDDGAYGTVGPRNAGYVSYTSLSGQIAAGRGVAAWLYGDAAAGRASSTGTMSGGLTIVTSGSLREDGDAVNLPVSFSSSSTNKGWNLVANPFASSIDWNSVAITKTSLDASIYRFDPQNNLWTTNNGTSGTNSADNIIESGAAFFVKANAIGAALSIGQDAKTGTATTFTHFSRVPKLPVQGQRVPSAIKSAGVRVSVIGQTDPAPDEVYLDLSRPDATPDFDAAWDASSMGRSGGTGLALKGTQDNWHAMQYDRPISEAGVEQRYYTLRVTGPATGQHTLVLRTEGAWDPLNSVALIDRKAGRTILVKDGSLTYAYQAGEQKEEGRFLLAINHVKLSADGQSPAFEVKLLGNPVTTSVIDLLVSHPTAMAKRWRVVDAAGRETGQGSFSTSGGLQHRLTVPGMRTPGAYIVQVEMDNGETQQVRILRN